MFVMTDKKQEIRFFWNERKPRVNTVAPFHYKDSNSFYASTPWRRLREYKLSEDPICERCSERGLTVPAGEVHHIVEIHLAPDRALDYDNLESICKVCHSKESYKFLQNRTIKKGGIINYQSKYLDPNATKYKKRD